MRAAFLHGPGDLRLHDVTDPVLAPGDLLVSVAACGLCQSDVRLWQSGYSDLLRLPAIIGHEAVGVVTGVGAPADKRLLGDRVFVDGYGGLAESTVVTAAMRRAQGGTFLLPERLPFDEAVFIEPLADCLSAVEGSLAGGGAETALVAGCGPMGLQLIRLLQLRGLDVVAIDPDDSRRDLARTFGATHVIPPGSSDSSSSFDIAIVACADPEAVVDCMDTLAADGTCVLFSTLPSRPVAIDLNRVHKRRQRILGTRWIINQKVPRWDLYRNAISLLSSRDVDVRPLLDRCVGFDHLEATFEELANARIMKAVLHPDGDLKPR